jgi:hypothetical protein
MKSTNVPVVAVTSNVPQTPTTPTTQPQPASPQPTSNVARIHARQPKGDEIELLDMLRTDPDDVEVDLHDMLQSSPPQSSVNQMTSTTQVITPSSGTPINPTTSTAGTGATTPRTAPEKASARKSQGLRLSKLFAGSPSRKSSRAGETPRSARDAATPRTTAQPTARVHFSMVHGKVPPFVAARAYGDMMKLCKSTAGFEATHDVLLDWIGQWPDTGQMLDKQGAQARARALPLAHAAVAACNRAQPQEAAEHLLKLVDYCERSGILAAAQLHLLRSRAEGLMNRLEEGPRYEAVTQLQTVANVIHSQAIDPLVAPLALIVQQIGTGKDNLALLSTLEATQIKNLFSDADWVEKNGAWLAQALGAHTDPTVGAERAQQLAILRMAQSIHADALKGDYSLVALSQLHTAMVKTIDVNGRPQSLVNVSGSDIKAVEAALNPMSAEAFRRVSASVIKSMLELISQIPGDLV